MSILERLRRLIASNINALVESWSDPGSQIDELIANMEAASREARDQLKAALIEDKRAVKLVDKLDQSIAEWGDRAARAVKAGDDALAREALSRKQSIEEERTETETARRLGRTHLDELERNLRELDAKISAVKARKETLKTVVRARAMNKKGDSAADRYDRIVTGVDVQEAENQLDEELNAEGKTADVRQRIDKLQSETDVDARLAALKNKMKP